MENEPLHIFQEDLWDGIDILEKNENYNIQLLKNLLYIFIEMENLEKEYSNGLLLLSNSLCFPSNKPISKSSTPINVEEKTLSIALNHFKLLINSLIDIHRNLSSEINSLIGTVGVLINNNLSFQQFTEKDKLYREEYEKVIKELNMSKINYFKESKQAAINHEEYTISTENPNIKNDSIKLKLKDKFDKQMETARNCSNIYMETLIKTNDQREIFIKKEVDLLCEIEMKNINFYQEIKKIFDKFIKINEASFDKLKSSITNEKEYFNKIDYKIDLPLFAKENLTNRVPPNKIDFISFSSNIDKINKYDKAPIKNITPKMRDFVNKTFGYEIPELSEFNVTEEAKTNRVYYEKLFKIAQQTWQGKISNDEEKDIEKLFEENNKFMKFFLECLNKNRAELTILDKDGFKLIKQLMKKIISICEKNKDIETIRLIIILSQTFYKNKKDQPKVLLQDKIKDLDIWKKKELWNLLIKKQIIIDIDRAKSENKSIINANIDFTSNIFSVLITYKFNMKSFGLDDQFIEDILNENIIYYKLPTESAKDILLEKVEQNSHDDINQEQIQNDVVELTENIQVQDENIFSQNKDNND